MSTFQPDETMLHNYLQNKLSPTEEEQLELWLADHPEALEDLELDLVMKEGVDVLNSLQQKFINYHLKNKNIIPNWNLFNFTVFGLLILTSMTFWYLNHQNYEGIQITSSQEFIIGQTRSSNEVIEINYYSNQIVLKLDLKSEWSDKYNKFKATISIEDEKIELHDLEPNWDNQIALVLSNLYSENEEIDLNIIINESEREEMLNVYTLRLRPVSKE